MLELNLEHTHLKRTIDVSDRRYESINLAKNYLRYLLSEDFPPTLKHLNLDQNDIQHLELSTPLPNLESLSIEKNNLKYIEIDIVLSSLKRLNLRYNELKNLEFLENMPVVEHLDLNGNQVKRLESLPSTLKTLKARFCKIKMIQSRLPSGLEELNLLGNFLHNASLPFHWGSQLKYLDLGYNQLKKFPKNLPDTVLEIRLVDNQIEEIPSKLPAQLKRLVLSKNKIRTLPEHTNVVVDLLKVCNNQLTRNFHTNPIKWSRDLILEGDNWNTDEHHDAQRKIQKCWKRYILNVRLRHYSRARKVYDELLMVALHPDHILQTDVFSPEWFQSKIYEAPA